MEEEHDVAAGRFSTWLAEVVADGAGHSGPDAPGVDVPCGSCTSCCRSSYFVHIGRDETETLRRIPKELLFPAPGLPEGDVVLGYDERGHCPMLVDDRCSIYEHRPRTCRSYDCRVYAAAGLSPLDDGKALVGERVGRWRFDVPTATDEAERAAVRAAAAFLAQHPSCFPDGAVPTSTGHRALIAVRVHRLFLRRNDAGARELVEPDVGAVTAALRR